MEWLQYIYESISSFVSPVVKVLSYIWSMLESMWYGLTTLLSGAMDMIENLFSNGLF